MRESQLSETSWIARLPFYYGWVIVAVIFMRSFTTAGAIWATGVLSVPMHDDLGWSRSVIFAGITLRTLGAATGGFLFGKYLDRTGGARLLGFGSGIVAASGLFLVAVVQESWQFLLIFGLLGGLLGAGPAALLMGAIVPKWFIRRRGRAVATATMGTGLAAFILPVVITLVSETLGWRYAWVFLGCFSVVLAVLPALLLRTRPEDIGLRPDGDTDEPAQDGQPQRRRTEEVSFTRAEAMRTPTLWLIVAIAMFASVSPGAYPINLVPAFVERGFSPSTAAIGFSAYGMLSFGGRFFWGQLADRLHIRKVLLIVATYTGMTVPLLLILPGDIALISGAVAGLGIGGWVGLNQVVWAAYFGRDNLGAITGSVRPFVTLSGATGPLYAAVLADLTGNYTLSYSLMALSWWLCALFLLPLRPAKLPERLRAQSAGATASKDS